VNLAAAAFSRYPWKKHHAGFVITHAGIITLLVGALVGRIWGIEGTMTLFVGDGPSNRLVMDQQEVRVQEGPKTAAFPVGLQYQHYRLSGTAPQFTFGGNYRWTRNSISGVGARVPRLGRIG
jgi:hypothetical protein